MAIRIVWVGCHSEGIKAYGSILKSGQRMECFVTLNDEAFQKRSSGSREYIELCEQYNIPVQFISSIKSEDAFDIVQEAKPDLLIVLGWSEILPERLLDIPTIGTVGAHAALLPHNRGSAPINWALIKGETSCGNSLMWLDKEVDQGAIIDQIGFDIDMYDTCKTLYNKVADTNEIMLLRLIQRLNDGLGTVMNKSNVTDEALLPRRRPKDGLIDWNQDSTKIYNFIRALTRPYPGAFTYLNGHKYLIWSASLLPDNTEKIPGKIDGSVYSPVLESCGVQVECGIGKIIIHEIEDENGTAYSGRKLAEMNLEGQFRNGGTD